MRDNSLQHWKNAGFTLIEVLIALLVSAIVMTAIYVLFKSQQDSYLAQDQVVEMQQNIRAGLDLMLRETRMAGYDPSGNAGAGVVSATAGTFRFTKDDNEDGDTTDTDENITYGLSSNDSNGDGIADGNGVAPLGRDTNDGNGFQEVAENIQAIEFYYTLVDANGNYSYATAPAATNLGNIRSVQVSILARAGNPDPNFSNTMTYSTGSGAAWGPYNDNYRRRLLKTTITCRNLGF